MANPFKDWTPEMAASHNIRIIERRKKPSGNDQNHPTSPQPYQPQSKLQLQPLGALAKAQGDPAGVHRGVAQAGPGRPGQGALPELQTLGRTAIIITDYRVKTLDEDNLISGGKGILDCLRYARFIADDRPEDVKLFVRQQKVQAMAELRTEIEMTPIADNWNQEALFRLPALIVRLLANDVSALEELAEMMP